MMQAQRFHALLQFVLCGLDDGGHCAEPGCAARSTLSDSALERSERSPLHAASLLESAQSLNAVCGIRVAHRSGSRIRDFTCGADWIVLGLQQGDDCMSLEHFVQFP